MDRGADPNLDIDGATPFHVAVGIDEVAIDELVKLLLQNGANPNSR